MNKFTKEMVDEYANKLLIGLTAEENQMVLDEFSVIDESINVINNIKDIDKVEPMTFPFDLELNDDYLREDVYNNEITFDDMKINVKDYEDNRVKVPKVVE